MISQECMSSVTTTQRSWFYLKKTHTCWFPINGRPQRHFYNNCLISCMLIGSFLSSIRVKTEKILFKQARKFFSSGNQKAIKGIDNIRVILNIIHQSVFRASLQCLFPSFFPGIWPFWGLVIVKKQLTSYCLISNREGLGTSL